jgi:hypothetical protein
MGNKRTSSGAAGLTVVDILSFRKVKGCRRNALKCFFRAASAFNSEKTPGYCVVLENFPGPPSFFLARLRLISATADGNAPDYEDISDQTRGGE